MKSRESLNHSHAGSLGADAVVFAEVPRRPPKRNNRRAVSDETYQAHRGDALFLREENSTRRFLIVHVAEQRRHVTAFHADAFELHVDYAPLILALVEIK